MSAPPASGGGWAHEGQGARRQSGAGEGSQATIQRDWLTIQRIVARYGLEPNRVRNWVIRGDVPSVQLRVPWSQSPVRFCRPCDVDALLASLHEHGTLAAPPPGTRDGRVPQLLTPGLIRRYPGRAVLVAGAVARAYECSVPDLLTRDRGPSRVQRKRVLLAVLAAMPDLYAAHLLPTMGGGWGPSDLGRMVGVDHTTVLHHRLAMATWPTWEEQQMVADASSEASAAIAGMLAAALAVREMVAQQERRVRVQARYDEQARARREARRRALGGALVKKRKEIVR